MCRVREDKHRLACPTFPSQLHETEVSGYAKWMEGELHLCSVRQLLGPLKLLPKHVSLSKPRGEWQGEAHWM
jgi:hypothetical protein